ncbi:MAG: hypothetical protein ABFC84_02230 [Veillonellales bacterium]
MESTTDAESSWQQLFQQYNLAQLVEAAAVGGWQPVWQKFEELCQNHPFQSETERHITIDLSMCYFLSHVPPESSLILWELIGKWRTWRKLPERYPALPQEEQAAAVCVCLRLREKLREHLLHPNCLSLSELPENYQQIMLELWPQVFLNLFSPLHMLNRQPASLPFQPAGWKKFGYPGLLVASMYYPADADDFNIDSMELFASNLPFLCKTILLRWMIYIPYFSGTMKHRDRLVRYVPEICRAITSHPEIVSQAYFVTLVQEVMTGFWRASYIGGNNLTALSAFGDTISTTIHRFCPQLPKMVSRTIHPGEKIRVGYISRNFFRQAVSYYMINRILYHDRSRFEVFVYALGEYKDEFTDMYAKNSEHFEQFTNLQNFSAIINSVINSKLDILIFTDIGMDVVTYILAGLKMAPIQCAMVGHGTTTGLPTIDYYISGDFEHPDAQSQYREKLIRLPNLGAAQYLPDSPAAATSRVELGIPDDAVLFISCANGIKQRPERDEVYVEILKQAPNAWILLKPYTTRDGIDAKMAKRLRTLADEAGVGKRLLILPALGNYRNVLGLLSIADVQLDTYPYGGWTTNLEALFLGLPVVTQEGELSRSRWGAGMLRALGISEGIGANEEEYIAWAVRLAGDSQLRWRVSQKIKKKAMDTLFNGPAAQPSFENTLFQLLSAESPPSISHPQLPPADSGKKIRLKKLGRVEILLPNRIYVATSIAPRNQALQQAALSTWLAAGFQVISLNPQEEIEQLQSAFPDVEFRVAARDARRQFQHPYIYFDDLLACLARTQTKISGIINSDIYLLEPKLLDFIAVQSDKTVLFTSRIDVPTPESREGKWYPLGFDCFFFSQDLLQSFPQEAFCLGLPWWDYWAALMPLKRRWPVKRLITPAAVHVSHQTAWTKESWLTLGTVLANYVPCPFALTNDTMLKYLHTLAQKINNDASDIWF